MLLLSNRKRGYALMVVLVVLAAMMTFLSVFTIWITSTLKYYQRCEEKLWVMNYQRYVKDRLTYQLEPFFYKYGHVMAWENNGLSIWNKEGYLITALEPQTWKFEDAIIEITWKSLGDNHLLVNALDGQKQIDINQSLLKNESAFSNQPLFQYSFLEDNVYGPLWRSLYTQVHQNRVNQKIQGYGPPWSLHDLKQSQDLLKTSMDYPYDFKGLSTWDWLTHVPVMRLDQMSSSRGDPLTLAITPKWESLAIEFIFSYELEWVEIEGEIKPVMRLYYEPKFIFCLYNPYNHSLVRCLYDLSFYVPDHYKIKLIHRNENSSEKVNADFLNLPYICDISETLAFKPGERVVVEKRLPKQPTNLNIGLYSVDFLSLQLEQVHSKPIKIKAYARLENGGGVPICHDGTKRFTPQNVRTDAIAVSQMGWQPITLCIDYELSTAPRFLLPDLFYPIGSVGDLFWQYYHPDWPLKAMESILENNHNWDADSVLFVKKMYGCFLDQFYIQQHPSVKSHHMAKTWINLNSSQLVDWNVLFDHLQGVVNNMSLTFLVDELVRYTYENRPFFTLSEWLIGKELNSGASIILLKYGVNLQDFLKQLGPSWAVREDTIMAHVVLRTKSVDGESNQDFDKKVIMEWDLPFAILQ